MQTTESPSTGAKLNADMAAMVKEISVIGPRIPEVARRLGRHKETVRYWYGKLEENDFAVQAMLNHEALGLKRVVLKAEFGPEYSDYVKPMMFAMNELCYVTSYAKALPEDVYVLHASVPTAHVGEYVRFTDALRDQGVFRSVEPYQFEWFRNVPMRGDSYDFETGHWEFDLPSLVKKELPYTPPVASPRSKFDRLDLLIAKELQIDATRELGEIQRSIKERDGVDVNYKTLCWHMSEHVQGNGLLKGYRINWMGSRWDPITDKARHRSHSYVVMHILVKGPSAAEKMEILRMMDRLPIIWSEAAGDDYFVEIAFPSEMVLDGLLFLQRLLDSVRDKVSYYVMDQKNATGFTFSYNLYDEGSKVWKFNSDELLLKFKALESQIRSI